MHKDDVLLDREKVRLTVSEVETLSPDVKRFRLLFPEIFLLFQGPMSGLDMQPASESQPAPSISAGALHTGVEGREGT